MATGVSARRRYQEWLNYPNLMESDRQQLLSIREDEAMIKELFSSELAFGTGGLRGLMGLGSDRINRYTVAKASLGIGHYLLTECQQPSVVIGYDSRHQSDELAMVAAECFSSLGIRVHLFAELRPTPEISYAIRRLAATAGVIVTASHNPKEYNGYKVYWSDGCQITPPVDQAMIAFVHRQRVMWPEKPRPDLIETIDWGMDEAYLSAVRGQSIRVWDNQVTVVYSPLNGTGGTLIPKLLAEMGYCSVYLVESQAEPDGDFPTVPQPNPENPSVYQQALALAKEIDADIVIATDPDADRMGCWCRKRKGDYHRLTGNLSGAVIGQYLLAHSRAEGTRDGQISTLEKNQSLSLTAESMKRPTIIKTIVTGRLIDRIAEAYQAEVVNVLTGFKYIGQLIDQTQFLFGMEESYGLLAGTYARDKDAVLATMLIVEVVGYQKSQGRSLYQWINQLYEDYGYSCDAIETMTFPGNQGKEQMNRLLADLRSSQLTHCGNRRIQRFIDYLHDDTGLPKSDVLFYEVIDGWFCIRRSGTEPKMKLYFEAESEEVLESLIADVKCLVQQVIH